MEQEEYCTELDKETALMFIKECHKAYSSGLKDKQAIMGNLSVQVNGELVDKFIEIQTLRDGLISKRISGPLQTKPYETLLLN